MTNRHLLLTSLFILLFAWRATAQFTPQGFNYQCIVRDNSGATLNNQTVTLLFTVRSGAPNGPVAYSEKQTTSTNEYGLINLIIGQGAPLQGAFNSISWGNGAKFLTVSVETSPNVFDELGSSQLMSVPYALYAQNTANSGDNWGTQVVQTSPPLSGAGTTGSPLALAQQGAQAGQALKWNGSAWAPQNDETGPDGTVTTINTGSGLTGGPVTTSGTISLANTPVSPGVYGSANQIPVIAVDQHGRITDVFTVPVPPNTIGITGAAGINVTQNGVNFTITNTGDIDAGDDITTASQADGDLNGPFSNLQIKANAVGNAELADNAVGNTELTDNAVGNAEMADNAVNTAELSNGAVTAAKLNNMGATSGQVLKWNGSAWAPAADNAGITNLTGGAGISITGVSPNLTVINTGDTDGNDDLTTVSVANGDVSGPFSNLQIKPDAVGASELAGNAVTTPKINAGAVTGDKIAQMSAANGQVLKWNGASWAPAADNLGSVTITGGVGIDVIGSANNYTIANGGDVNPFDDLTTASQADGDLSGPFSNLQIKQSIISSFELANNAVTAAKINAGAVTGEKIAQMSATTGQVLKWNGTAWAPAVDGGGDNWGTQFVQTGATLTGTGTTGSPLNLSPQSASIGQVLKFNGTTWVPQNDALGGADNWGTQTAQTNFTLIGNGTVGNELGLAPQGALPGQVLKFTNGVWTPQDDAVGAADNWGAQVATTNATLTGDGANTPLGIAAQNATNGQVLKFNGSTWAPANEAGGDDWGTQTAKTNFTLIGNGTVGNELGLAPQNAANGQVLKFDGAVWIPQDDEVGAGDDWGAQVATTNATLTGDGANTPLGIAAQGATNGQVLKFDGNTWVPQDDNTGSGPADNWGTQVAITSPTLSGNGTAGNPLGIAPQGATNGQVLKFNGTTWAPANEASGDNWGTQTAKTNPTLIGNGTVGNELGLAPQGATAGQVLKFDGTFWEPADDNTGNTYNAGTGINITGTPPNLTIANTGDLSNTNELQTLSLAGAQLILSNGGGTVNLPPSNTYDAGAGINITGSAPNFTIVNTGDSDNNATNELQTLSLTGKILKISGTNSAVDLDTVLTNAGIGLWSGMGLNIYNSNAGNVGIGTNTPAAKFHVKADGEALRVQGTNPSIRLVDGAGGSAGTFGMTSKLLAMVTSDSSSIMLATAGGKNFTIDGISGNIGAGGFNTGNARLKVMHGGGAGGLMIENTDGGGNWEFQVDGNSGALTLYNSTLGAIPAGSFALNGVYTPSDRRLKKDIAPLAAVLNKMMLLEPVTYRYNPEKADAQASVGFIAQDILKHFPELVGENTAQDGNRYLALNYAGFSVLAVKAIQEQQSQINALQAQNSLLIERLNSLEQRLLGLEQARASANK